MEMSYLTGNGTIASKEFEPYLRDGVELTSLLDTDSGKLIDHMSYDAVKKGYAALSSDFQKVYRDEILRRLHPGRVPDMAEPSLYEKLSHDKQQDYDAARASQSLTYSRTDMLIVKDHALDKGKGRQEKVYNVGGHPVIARNMTPKLVSSLEGNLTHQAAARMLTALKNPDPTASGMVIQKELGLNKAPVIPPAARQRVIQPRLSM